MTKLLIVARLGRNVVGGEVFAFPPLVYDVSAPNSGVVDLLKHRGLTRDPNVRVWRVTIEKDVTEETFAALEK